MEDIKELVKEFVQYKYALHKKYRDLKYIATGLYHLGDISEDELNLRLQVYAKSEAIDCKMELYNIAKRSENPLAIWCVNNLDTHRALYVIRRLPLYADEMDELAKKNNWCNYPEYRADAIKSGAMFEREQ